MNNVIDILEVAKAEVEWNYPLDYAIAIDKAIEACKKIENIELIIQSFRDESEDLEDAFYEICKAVENGNDK